jgi:histone H2A
VKRKKSNLKMYANGNGDKVNGKAKCNPAALHRVLRQGNYAESVDAGVPVYLSAVMEYLTTEVLELTGNTACDNKNMRIILRHLQLAIRNIEEFDKLLSGVTIARVVLPPIKTEKNS